MVTVGLITFFKLLRQTPDLINLERRLQASYMPAKFSKLVAIKLLLQLCGRIGELLYRPTHKFYGLVACHRELALIIVQSLQPSRHQTLLRRLVELTGFLGHCLNKLEACWVKRMLPRCCYSGNPFVQKRCRRFYSCTPLGTGAISTRRFFDRLA